MRQSVGENVTDGFFEFRAAGKVSTLMGCIAPTPVLGPMPCGHAQLGVITIGDRTPPGRQRFLEDVRGVNPVNFGVRQDIDRAAERAIGIEGIEQVAGGDVDAHRPRGLSRLGRSGYKNPQQRGQASRRNNASSHERFSSPGWISRQNYNTRRANPLTCPSADGHPLPQGGEGISSGYFSPRPLGGEGSGGEGVMSVNSCNPQQEAIHPVENPP